MLGAVAQLVAGLLAVLMSAWLFTNALEWLGVRMGLSHSALGSVFAALGTALPEASIAVLAAVAPGPVQGGPGDAISIGAVLGAPLLLGTLGFAVLGFGALRAGRSAVRVSPTGLRRDMGFFLLAFGVAAVLGVVGAPPLVRWPAGAALLGAYVVFILRTLNGESRAGGAGPVPAPLLLSLRRRGSGAAQPPTAWAMAAQVALAVGVMFGGAELFVQTLTSLSLRLGLSGFVLAALIAPLATELPETVNSLVWLGQDKDALATGNVTGALVLQGAVIPAVGMWFTPWAFDPLEAVAAAVAWLGALAVLLGYRRAGRLSPWLLLAVGALYVGFAVWVL